MNSTLHNKQNKWASYTIAASAIFIGACSNSAPDHTLTQQETERKEALAEISEVNKQINAGLVARPVTNKPVTSNSTKFSSNAYGVAGSPRVTNKVRVKKGGGRYQVGKPYTIRGKKYYPREDPNYNKVGSASWYGPNFHGRLTANGEVYDQFGLSAAHPTLPLPSYAKVTNLENGSSVTVRINDRGPFSKNRIIDLSARAAQLLGYEHKGVAKVRVEYVGKARLDGLDEQYLVASYNPGGVNQNNIPALPNGQPVLVAQANDTVRQPLSAFSPAPIPQVRPVTNAGQPLVFGLNEAPRPSLGLASYFDDSQLASGNKASSVLERFDAGRLDFEERFSMQEVIHVRFGPFENQNAMEKAETYLLEHGSVTVVAEGEKQFISLSTIRSNLADVYGMAKRTKLPLVN